MDIQSKAKKLIEMIQTAPVEWKPLGEVAEIGTGSSNRQDEEHDGEYPFYVRSKNILRSSTYQFNETAIIIPGEGGIGDIFHYAEGKYALHQRAYRVHVVIPDLSPKFLYYFMNVDFKRYIQAKSVGATATSIRKPMLQRFPIPIPPLEIQQKIVKILDKFTELEATLEAELALRKRQYRYYRDFLLDFDNQIGGGIADGYQCRLKDVVWKTLGEVAEYSKNRICSDKLNEHNYVGVDNLLQNREGKKLSGYVPSEGKMTEYIVNDILIGNIRPYLKKIWQADCTGGTNGDVLVIRITDEKVNPKYLYQVLADDKFFAFNMKHAKGAKMPRGSKTAIMQYKIPIPPLPEQEKIVAILDKFDTLTHSVSEGLPHEIALRRKQYEYYREQLLAFR
ncbi:restriction endonuclease subunit S [Neisseria polysaccharea]|uniref:restriction endonuclease subunit S n=1 Tax=Neisseria polysaccharea TaxID=489 RepID=UPI00272DB985|nr:restriction endonuclease subunit S [Neisseria polysaccharea]